MVARRAEATDLEREAAATVQALVEVIRNHKTATGCVTGSIL